MSFLDSFCEAWDIAPETDPKTVRALIRLAKSRLSDDGLEPALNSSLQKLTPLVTQVLDANIQDLENAGDLDPKLRQHFELCIEGYEKIVESMELLQESDVNLSEELGLLIEAADEVEVHQSALQNWTSKPSCPRCGFQEAGELSCPDCRVHLTLPDPMPPRIPSFELGPNYVAVRSACEGVATGQAPLEQLHLACDELGAELTQLSTLARQGARLGASLEELQKQLQDSAQALDDILVFERSCAVADLNRGWLALATAGESLKASIQELSAEL